MNNEFRKIRYWIIFFMIALFVSGFTAIPLETELAFLSRCFSPGSTIGGWIEKVYAAIAATNKQYPFIAYGSDWLAFAHFVLAILFVGPLRDPIKNIWVIDFAMIACLLVIPFAFVAGEIRGIPIWWRLVDCSFGVVGLIPLSICRSKIIMLEKRINASHVEVYY